MNPETFGQVPARVKGQNGRPSEFIFKGETFLKLNATTAMSVDGEFRKFNANQEVNG